MTAPATRSVRLTGWGRYAPAQVLTNADLERMVDTSDEWIVSAGPGSASGGSRPPTRPPRRWAPSPGLRAIHTAGLEPDDIDVIILATLTPDYWMPSTAALVKEAIGNTKASAFDVDGRLLRLRLRLRDGERVHRRRAGEARARDRRGAAHPVPRLHRPEHLHPVRRRGGRRGPVGVRRADGAPVGIELTTEPAGRLHDLAARRRLEEPAVAARRSPAASTRSAWRARRRTGSRPGRSPRRRSPPSAKAGWQPGRRRPDHPAPGQRPDHRGRGQGPGPADGPDVRQPRQVRQHLGRVRADRPRRGRQRGPRRRSATRSCSWRSARASRPAPWRWSGPPTRPAAAAPTTPSGPRTSPSGCRSTGTRSTRSRRPSPRSSPGRCPSSSTCPTSCPGEPERVHQPVHADGRQRPAPGRPPRREPA